jgi:hypothetical protein
MRLLSHIALLTSTCLALVAPTSERPSYTVDAADDGFHVRGNVSLGLYAELEELARLVDIAYCHPAPGISRPFVCASHCGDFPGWQLIRTFETGVFRDGSAGFMALEPVRGNSVGRGAGEAGRIFVVWRGTYSLLDLISDLSTVPQEFVPFPGTPNATSPIPTTQEPRRGWRAWFPDFLHWSHSKDAAPPKEHGDIPRCDNCTVHTGFYNTYLSLRPLIIPMLESLHDTHPDHTLHLVGHSLGGAIAGLFGLELALAPNGWNVTVTTYGEPRIGNAGFAAYMDAVFAPDSSGDESSFEGNPTTANAYRRVTHTADPVPLLPLRGWGYRSHASEIFIRSLDLPPQRADLTLCDGSEDPGCSAGEEDLGVGRLLDGAWLAHRDYFWRLGVCVPGGDPANWGREGRDEL